MYVEREGDKSDENDEYSLFKLLSRNMRKIKKQRIKLNLYVFNFLYWIGFFFFEIKIFIIHRSLFQYNVAFIHQNKIDNISFYSLNKKEKIENL